MGRMIAHKTQDLSERARTAFDQFMALPDNATLQERVQLARDRDAGYRGVAPLAVDGEPLNGRFAVPAAPSRASILAADGSQIYPDIHGAAQYYLTNVAVFTFFHGEDRLPVEFSEPHLAYADSLIRDHYDQLVTNATVNGRRTVKEMQMLAQFAWDQRAIDASLVALFDGRLLFWLGKDVPEASSLEKDYKAGLVRVHDTHHWMVNQHGHNASLVGYVDRPTSRFVTALLQLMLLDPAQVTRGELRKPGSYEGLDDRWLFERLLQFGERSALMIQQSPQNKAYRQRGENYEIAFIYLNVGRPHLARVEMPMWVALNPQAVDEIHAVLVDQCRIAGHYPYVLTRADELAVVQTNDRQTLEELIRQELIRNMQQPEVSGKLMGKFQARAGRQRFELKG